MSVIEIKDQDGLRVGDVATFAYAGHEFTGRLWTEGGKTLYVGDALVRYTSGNSGPYEFVRATREVPDLPTEPGSLIHIVRLTDAEPFDKPLAALLMNNGQWVTLAPIGKHHTWLISEQIAEWTPAKVVPA